MIISTAENVSDKQIINLWQECFGDDDEYISAFLKAHPKRNRILTVTNGEDLCSMLFLLECEAVYGKESYPAWYIYAACTSAVYRRQGLMAKLLEYAKKYAEEEGISFLLLVPANKELFDYYGKFGYKTYFYRQKVSLVENTEIYNSTSKKAEIKDLYYLREKCLNNLFHIKWSEEALKYALNEHTEYGGHVTVTDNAYALWSVEDNELTITEALGTEPSAVNSLLKSISNDKGVLNISGYTVCDFPENGIPFGMILPCSEKAQAIIEENPCGYLGLALD